MSHNGPVEYPEELLSVFKAAALSVTKLYKTSTTAQAKARVDGYQDCLEDLLALLDKGGCDVRVVRRWAAERLDGRDSIVPTIESEDEVDKTDATSTPEPQRRDSRDSRSGPSSTGNHDTAMRSDTGSPSPSTLRTAAMSTTNGSNSAAAATSHAASSSSAAVKAPVVSANPGKTSSTRARLPSVAENSDCDYLEPVEVSVPMQGAFTFRAPMAYPPESYLQLANLDLSDKFSAGGPASASEPGADQQQHTPSAAASPTSSASSSSPHGSKPAFRVRHSGPARFGSRTINSARIGRGNAAGTSQKRKLNVEEIFDLASLGYGKDVFGRAGPSKRPRQG
ncbi:hypothetical protein CMQ_1406 [Grosmannia clavigera kw1407]|uniref:Uncharacterized protein n=1 Tax=Grosmannia clavigera (strain kw1407 / UAMH 11150) TaxID=655863 RepID=F0XCX5_GROCL|nr:uncharacterized protein CMQ_1406 [Grosmannia clavigera kw1407]EFX04478.1 hypothetical protein CMQ_1406 [Grosmannia clavigera kw1407]